MGESKTPKTRRVTFSDELCPSKMTIQNVPQDNPDMTEVSLTLVNDAISAAFESAQDLISPIKNIKWMTHGEFTAEVGRTQIQRFVLRFEYQIGWVCHTEFVKREDIIHSFHYIYRVHWSLPSALFPVAEISTFAQFTIKINKRKPPDAPTDVSFVFEEHSLIQRPGMARFRDKWLRELIEIKYNIIRTTSQLLGIKRVTFD